MRFLKKNKVLGKLAIINEQLAIKQAFPAFNIPKTPSSSQMQATNGSDYKTSRAVARVGSGASPPFFEKKVLPLKLPFPKNFGKKIAIRRTRNQSARICFIRRIRVRTVRVNQNQCVTRKYRIQEIKKRKIRKFSFPCVEN